mmetsp:Transcript_603/g.1247  ORF Transcript_603/g.1247 Transcript_603/m.1247 type:complete len:89 (+) Transcript_603:37-303(+)
MASSRARKWRGCEATSHPFRGGYEASCHEMEWRHLVPENGERLVPPRAGKWQGCEASCHKMAWRGLVPENCNGLVPRNSKAARRRATK